MRAIVGSVTGGRLTIRRRPSPGALLAPADWRVGALFIGQGAGCARGHGVARWRSTLIRPKGGQSCESMNSWARKNPDLANKGDPILFFSYLQSERSELLDFKSRGVDKWQTVHGWLLSSGRVKTRQ